MLVDLVSLCGAGISQFTVSGLTPAADAGDPFGFPTFLTFNDPTGSFTMSGVTLPSTQIEAIIGAVGALEAEGAISGGLANSLTAKLNGAKNRASSQPEAAIGQLNAFINQVTALVRRGVLSFPQGQALIQSAQNIITALAG